MYQGLGSSEASVPALQQTVHQVAAGGLQPLVLHCRTQGPQDKTLKLSREGQRSVLRLWIHGYGP